MNDLTKQEAGELTVPKGVFGAGDDISASDIRIGRISVMQSMSKLVQAEQARRGAIIELDTQTELGYKTEAPFEFIPIKSFKYWIEKEDKKFKSKFPANDPNELKREEGKITRMYHHAFYVLLPNELSEGIEMPYEIAFRSTDLVSAQKISKFLLNMRRKEMASWDKVFSLTTVPRQKDDHQWFGTEIALGRDTTQFEKAKCYDWYKQVTSAKNVNVTPHEDDDTGPREGLSQDVRY